MHCHPAGILFDRVMQTKPAGYEIRVMKKCELAQAIDWAAAEGWNPGLHDLESFWAADSTGFLMGFLDGEPIASISAVKYGDSFAFVGFYIVKQEHRGSGYGLQLWHAAMESLGKRVLGLDGVVEQQENYKKSGFQLAYRNVRYQGKTGVEFPVPLIDMSAVMVPANEVDFTALHAYDRQFFPADRQAFLQSWISADDSEFLCVSQDGEISGFGGVRKCRDGYKIGPLYAERSEIAESILDQLLRGLPAGENFYLDVPEPNMFAVQLAESLGMQVVFETARMYRGAMPMVDFFRLYGVTSFELG